MTLLKKTDLINSSEILPLNAQKIWDKLNYENSVSITSKIINAFNENIFDKAYLIYNSFKNAAIQITVNESFLPVSANNENIISPIDYIFEPDQEEILNELIPNTLKITLYKALLDSFASEHGARMTAMHKATDNANEMKNELKLFYNKARQAAITNEILEIVAGAEALGG
jgi:F-type H+-transporting ATPase subunit gamma